MTASERVWLDDHIHHLACRTTEGQSVFLDEESREHCVQTLYDVAREYHTRIHSWCLLPDRLHLLVSVAGDASVLSSFMKALSCRVALHHKNHHGKPGPLWDGPFRSSPVEPGPWVLACMRYIERLPVILGLTDSPFHYYHSSYRIRLGKDNRYPLDDPDAYLALEDTPQKRIGTYRLYVKAGVDDSERQMIETALKRRRLISTERYVREVRRDYGIDAEIRKPGRPRKKDKEGEKDKKDKKSNKDEKNRKDEKHKE